MERINPILRTDSYKASHFLQYPPGTTKIRSYIEARGGKFDEGVFFGLQMFIREFMTMQVTQADIEEADKILTAHAVPFNREGWQLIVDEWDGYLPVEIMAVPEGVVVPVSNCLAIIENLDDRLPWVTNYVETALLRGIWYPMTVATTSFQCKRIIKNAMMKTSDLKGEDLDGALAFMLHDFGARGVSSQESAMIGGAAHLVNFMGTDTIEGIVAVQRYYDEEEMPAFSIPAAEHSTITMWGGPDNEVDAFENMLKQFGDGGLVAVVSDSYDIFRACGELWGEKLKQQVLDMPARLVIRPDSGDPKTVVLKCLEILGEKFGYTINSKGCKVLNDSVRVIQGDGINIDSLGEILDWIAAAGWSAENVAFGMGGGLLQLVNRDTMEFAMKACWALIDGVERDIFKEPVTMPGKNSKRGRLSLFYRDGEYVTDVVTNENKADQVLEYVYYPKMSGHGEMAIVGRSEKFSDIRARANYGLDRLVAFDLITEETEEQDSKADFDNAMA